MATKDVTDEMVCLAYHYAPGNETYKRPLELLVWKTGEPEKVCWRAMERACDRQLVEFGTSLNYGWLTAEGKVRIADEVRRLDCRNRYHRGLVIDGDVPAPDYVAGDRVRVIKPGYGLQPGEEFDCLAIGDDGWVAIRPDCIENGRIVDGFWWKRFEKVEG